MSEPLRWNIYAEMEVEVVELWQLVQDALAAFNLSETKEEETEIA